MLKIQSKSTLFGIIFTCGLSIATTVSAEGNRYGLERLYQSDVSASATFVNVYHHSKVSSAGKDPVIIDVRDVIEYSAGHAEEALSIPFPHIFSRPGKADYIAQDPDVFVIAVMEKITDLDTPIYTMCRTGFRSVLAANLLATAGYTNVRNIWEGFVGQFKVDTEGNTLDLNNNGALDDGDKDGWSNYAGLPVSNAMEDENLYQPYFDLYIK